MGEDFSLSTEEVAAELRTGIVVKVCGLHLSECYVMPYMIAFVQPSIGKVNLR